MVFRHRLQPDGLPDPGYAGIENPSINESLFAAQLERIVHIRSIDHLQDQGVFTSLHLIRDIETEGQVSADMPADFFSIYPNRGLVIDRLEMQQKPPLRFLLKFEVAAIPKSFVRLQRTPHAGQRRFDGKRHQDLPAPNSGPFVALARN